MAGLLPLRRAEHARINSIDIVVVPVSHLLEEIPLYRGDPLPESFVHAANWPASHTRAEYLSPSPAESRANLPLWIVFIVHGHFNLPALPTVQQIIASVCERVNILTSNLLAHKRGLISLLEIASFIGPIVLEVDDIESSSTFICISNLILLTHQIDFVSLPLPLFLHVLPAFQIALILLNPLWINELLLIPVAHLPLRLFNSSKISNVAILGRLEITALRVGVIHEHVVHVLVVISNSIPQPLRLTQWHIRSILFKHLPAQLLLKLSIVIRKHLLLLPFSLKLHLIIRQHTDLTLPPLMNLLRLKPLSYPLILLMFLHRCRSIKLLAMLLLLQMLILITLLVVLLRLPRPLNLLSSPLPRQLLAPLLHQALRPCLRLLLLLRQLGPPNASIGRGPLILLARLLDLITLKSHSAVLIFLWVYWLRILIGAALTQPISFLIWVRRCLVLLSVVYWLLIVLEEWAWLVGVKLILICWMSIIQLWYTISLPPLLSIICMHLHVPGRRHLLIVMRLTVIAHSIFQIGCVQSIVVYHRHLRFFLSWIWNVCEKN